MLFKMHLKATNQRHGECCCFLVPAEASVHDLFNSFKLVCSVIGRNSPLDMMPLLLGCILKVLWSVAIPSCFFVFNFHRSRYSNSVVYVKMGRKFRCHWRLSFHTPQAVSPILRPLSSSGPQARRPRPHCCSGALETGTDGVEPSDLWIFSLEGSTNAHDFIRQQ